MYTRLVNTYNTLDVLEIQMSESTDSFSALWLKPRPAGFFSSRLEVRVLIPRQLAEKDLLPVINSITDQCVGVIEFLDTHIPQVKALFIHYVNMVAIAVSRVCAKRFPRQYQSLITT